MLLLERLIDDFLPYTLTFAVVLLSSTLWYYVFVVKPFAKFPSWRLEIRAILWLLMGKKMDIVFLYEAIKQAIKYESEGLLVVWFFKPRVIVFGEEVVKSILPHTAIKPPAFRVAEFSFGEGIFISNGERWMKQKKMVAPALHTKALKSYVSFMNSNARAFVEKLSKMKGDTNYDICRVVSQCTLNLLYETNFGVKDGNAKEVEKSVATIHTTTEFFVYRFLRPWLHFNFWLPFSSYARHVIKLDEENRKKLQQILENVKETVAARDPSQVIEKDPDILSNRSKTIGENVIEDHLKCPVFTMEELTKEVYFLIFAGFDTAAHALVWILYALGRHPEVQDKAYNEIMNLKKDEIQYEDVQDLTYLDCVIKEALRKFTIPFLWRGLTKDVQCGKYFIPKNTEIILFPFMLHRDKNIYPDPEKFDPERFMDKNSKIRHWNHIPFMDGPRPCLGRNYAMLSMKIILVHVLRNFKIISLDREEDLTFKMSLVLCAENKPRVSFVPRHESQSALDLVERTDELPNLDSARAKG